MLASITSRVYHESAGFGQGFTVARVTKMTDPCKHVSGVQGSSYHCRQLQYAAPSYTATVAYELEAQTFLRERQSKRKRDRNALYRLCAFKQSI